MDKSERLQAIRQLANAQRQADEQRSRAQRVAQELVKKQVIQRVWIAFDGHTFRSPFELLFWESWRVPEIALIPQYRVGRYALDFAHPESLTCVEIDGYAYHSSKRAFVHDRRRQRALERLGWRVIRYSTSEIAEGMQACITEICEIIQARLHTLKGL